MAKVFYQTPIWQRDDAEFRTWGSTFSAGLAAVGLVKTSDIGQIDWATVSIPNNAFKAAGFEIWRLNDSMQAEYPIFIKFEYGRKSSAGIPCIWATIGGGSDGGGVISDPILGRTELGPSGSLNSDGLGRPVAISCVDGFFGFELGAGALEWAGNSPIGLLTISRTTDGAGVPTGEGVTVMYGTSALSTTSFAKGAPGVNLSTHIALIPPSVTTSTTADGIQAFPHIFFYPRARKTPFTATVFKEQVAPFTEFQATPLGATARNYICLSGGAGSKGVSSGGGGSAVLAMIWED